MDTRGYRIGYRSDIEGLRAIAILLVVAAHAKVSWLAGGFVGVDVFFELSGYLITVLLLQEIDKTGHLRFRTNGWKAPRALKSISADSGHIYIVRSTPYLPFDGPNCLALQHWLPWLHWRQGECDGPAFNKQGSDVYQ